MLTSIKTGTRFRSAVCTTEVIVVSAPNAEIDLRCGGQPMREMANSAEPLLPIDPSHAAGSALGKRYWHEATAFEVLCTKSGAGSLSVNGDALEVKVPKRLPSSD